MDFSYVPGPIQSTAILNLDVTSFFNENLKCVKVEEYNTF